MLETIDDCKKFLRNHANEDLILHVLPTEVDNHPMVNTPSVLFIKTLSSNHTYYYSFNHPDFISEIPWQWMNQEFFPNILSKKWTLDSKTFNQFIPNVKVCDANTCGYLSNNSIEEVSEFETPAHNLIRHYSNGFNRLNLCIPLMKHLETFENLAQAITKMVSGFKIDDAYVKINDIILPTLGHLESNGIFVDKNLFEKRFNNSPDSHGLTYTQYNPYTSTGRPSNRYGGVNYAALRHDDGSRACFRSRYGEDGRMVMIDYAAFHPRIICGLTNYNIPNEIDIYEYLAKLYFQKRVVDETDISNSKNLTFRQLYGGVEDKYSHIKYLANLKTYIQEQWEFFNRHGYVETPIFKRKITSHHIQDANPEKLFNYILQAVEGEHAIPSIAKVIDFLNGKQTKAVLYIYDAVLYDFHKSDGITTLNEIREIMSSNGRFPMKTYIGESYDSLKVISL